MKKVELKGIITPILTPMKEDESINTEELRNQLERLLVEYMGFSRLEPMARVTS